MEEKSNMPALFSNPSMEVMAQSDAAAVARAIQEVQAALVIAQRFPRDEVRAEARIVEACKRKGLAEVSEYEYSRGGTRITGPTIDLLRAIANRWGNLQFGWEEVERRNGQSSVRCFAWDLQSNGKAFRTFVVRHWRDTQGGGYEIKEERDIYELIANQAARRVRACLEEVIDADIVDKAVDQCRRTLKEGEKVPIKDRVVGMVNAFAEFGVTANMIEKRLGNKLDAVSENQLASLRRVFKALKDGVGQRDDYFKPDPAGPEFKDKGDPGSSGGPEGSAEPPPPPKTTPKAEKQPSEAPAGNPPPSGGSQGSFNPVKAIRALCKSAKIKESEVLGFLAQSGSTDGSVSSLEELQIQFPGVLSMVVEQWAEMSARIQGA